MKYLKNLKEYISCISKVKEYRGYWVKLEHVIIILICGSLCGLTSLEEIHDYAKSTPARNMLRKIFGIYLIPSYTHFLRLLKMIDSSELNTVFIAWCNAIISDMHNKTISLDGKTVKSTANMKEHKRSLHIVSAVLAEEKLTIGQLAVNSKSNEIPAVQELIKLLDVKGTIITADALNTQRNTAAIIVNREADYVLSVKENHKQLYNKLARKFNKAKTDMTVEQEKIETLENSRGRVEKRVSTVIHNIKWSKEKEEWKGLTAIGMIEKTNEINNQKETRYYLLSKNFTSKELLNYTRNEWSVETMHWLLDVNLREDSSRIRDKNLQTTFNIIRKITLNTIQRYKSKTDSKESISKIMRNNLFDTINMENFLLNL